MKFTPEVIAALAVLREHTENDFERHRLDVLERDLTAPPVVEVIDDKHQKFNGVTYTKNKCGHYSQGAAIHRDIWQYHHGEIPNGYVIHHIDNNKAHNGICNLQCLTVGEHQKIHYLDKDLRRRPPIIKKVCAFCGKEFRGEKNSAYRFCSERCAQNFRYRSGIDHETRTCPVCGQNFSVVRWAKTKYCSTKCAEIASGHRDQRICPICGKTFEVKHSKRQLTCSHSCGSKLMHQKRRQS